eukprot:TRINITY_DN122006_c0_g1_i1.p1 TRINITY_DN122006_c0_g1~~TRINITY_DN122006_c0_g1_i1.p1  ORF type:complete len:462 (-),score=84.04 TRINITY_DN122006_c0_g1_i1:102-1487(-)
MVRFRPWLALLTLLAGAGLPAGALAAQSEQGAESPQATALWASGWHDEQPHRLQQHPPHQQQQRRASMLTRRQRLYRHGQGHERENHERLRQHAGRQAPAAPAGMAGAAGAAAGPKMMPTLSLDAITPPTQFPPPPPRLRAWEDVQPLDTQLGDFLITGLGGDEVFAAPPTRPSLNIALGCPILMDWPQEVIVRLPDCGMPGNWFAQGSPPTVIMNWSTSCNIFSADLAPPVYYHSSHGEDYFGMSQTKTTLLGTQVRLFDCEGNVRYTIDEKVYFREGKADPDVCEKYGGCDGEVSLQYFIRDNRDKVVGQTSHLALFQDTVTVIASSGATIATAVRSAGWSPVSEVDCNIPREWTITFGEGAAQAFPSPSEQWPIAEMLTIMSVRDGYRRANGLMKPSVCEVVRGTLSFFIFLVILAFCVALGLFCHNILINRLRAQLVVFEAKYCPKRMKRSAKFEGV